MTEFAGVRVTIDRMGLDPAILALVREVEDRAQHPIEKPKDEGARLLSELLHYADGQQLINCVFAALVVLPPQPRSQPPVEGEATVPPTDPLPPASAQEG